LPPGMRFTTWGELCPLGGMFTSLSTLFRRIEGRRENFTPGDNVTPGGQLRPLGSKFAPRGEVKNGPQGFCGIDVDLVFLLWTYIPRIILG
jgi:hypothetical protein